jgi:hypothetical protein
MRGKTFITSCCLVAMMACGTAFAQKGEKLTSGPYNGSRMPIAAPDAPDASVFFSNFSTLTDPCSPNCTYDTSNGFLLLGPNNCFAPGSTQWLAYPFIASHTGTTRQVTLAITNDTALCTPTSSKFTVAIYSDNCTGVPVAQIGSSAIGTAAPAPCGTVRVRLAVPLTMGQKYWVVVTTSTDATQNATTAVWWEVIDAAGSVNFNAGMGWQASPVGGPGAFSVQ